MYPEVQQPLLGSNMWLNADFQNEHTAVYPNGGYPQYGPEATFDNSPFDTNSISQDEKALPMSSLYYPAAPVDIGPAAPVKHPFIPVTPEVGTQSVLDVPFNSLPAEPFQRDLAFQQWLPGQHPAHHLTHDVSQGYSQFPAQEPWEPDYPLAEAMETKPHGYSAFQFDEMERRSIHKKHRYDPSAYRIEGQETRFTCTIENCGKNFSGEWEKTRHIKSMHCPPTIGCRKCNYKQSRKDLFSEHCKKRHPGESIEDLRVQLDVPDA